MIFLTTSRRPCFCHIINKKQNFNVQTKHVQHVCKRVVARKPRQLFSPVPRFMKPITLETEQLS